MVNDRLLQSHTTLMYLVLYAFTANNTNTNNDNNDNIALNK